MVWESERKKKPAFSLLGDERLKSLIDLSVFKCTPALVCAVYVCVCVCVDAFVQASVYPRVC